MLAARVSVNMYADVKVPPFITFSQKAQGKLNLSDPKVIFI